MPRDPRKRQGWPCPAHGRRWAKRRSGAPRSSGVLWCRRTSSRTAIRTVGGLPVPYKERPR